MTAADGDNAGRGAGASPQKPEAQSTGNSEEHFPILANLPKVSVAVSALSFVFGMSYLFGSLIFLPGDFTNFIGLVDIFLSSLILSPSILGTAAFILVLGVLDPLPRAGRATIAVVKRWPLYGIYLPIPLYVLGLIFLRPDFFAMFILLLVTLAYWFLYTFIIPRVSAGEYRVEIWFISLIIVMNLFTAVFGYHKTLLAYRGLSHVVCYAPSTCSDVALLKSLSRGYIVRMEGNKSITFLPNEQVMSIESINSPLLGPLIDLFGLGEIEPRLRRTQ